MNRGTGRVCVITGASAGIGAAAALRLAGRGDRVVLVGRTPAKLDAVAERVTAETGQRPEAHVADFARLDDVRRLAAALSDAHPRIDVLVNNAGLIATRPRTTVDGHELTIQVNHLAPFLLTHLLLDKLRAGEEARVVTTASAAGKAGGLDPTDLDRAGKRWNGGWGAYCASKQANILFTQELARRLAGTSVVATCFHPGTIRSDFGTENTMFRLARMVPFVMGSPERGARTLVRLAVTADGVSHPGAYFERGGLTRRLPPYCTDPELARRLWDATLEALDLLPDPD